MNGKTLRKSRAEGLCVGILFGNLEWKYSVETLVLVYFAETLSRNIAPKSCAGILCETSKWDLCWNLAQGYSAETRVKVPIGNLVLIYSAETWVEILVESLNRNTLRKFWVEILCGNPAWGNAAETPE
jgi:hypothetical protein